MKRGVRTLAIFAVFSALVVLTGWAFTGLPREPKELPTGANVSAGAGHNVLSDGQFTYGAQVAKGWLQEYNTSGKPFYLDHDGVQEVSYSGQPGDTGVHRRIEVFQGVLHGVRPGQRWQFSIHVEGQISKGYMIAGMEWFNHKYIAEQDVYPHVSTTWQRITVVSPALPSDVLALAVYVQLPEINYMTKLDVRVTGASLIQAPAT